MSSVKNVQSVEDYSFGRKKDTMHSMSTFGDKLRQHRETKGLSQYRLAKLLDMQAANLSSIEKGRRQVGDDVMRKIASIPEMELDYMTMIQWKLADILSEYPKDIAEKAMEEAFKRQRRKRGLE